jgi:hypothetical protein
MKYILVATIATVIGGLAGFAASVLTTRMKQDSPPES